MEYEYLMTIGQDSHRFLEGEFDSETNSIMLGGFPVPHTRKFSANSDGDVILHAITNAISGYTTVNVLGGIADKLCLEDGIMDSSVFIKEAMKDMGDAKITHISLTIECLRPKLKKYIPEIRNSISSIVGIKPERIGITATTGEGLTDFGKGEGIQVFACLTFRKPFEE